MATRGRTKIGPQATTDLARYRDGLTALENLSVLLKGARLMAGMTATEAAAEIGVSAGHITNLEAGQQSGMRLDTALKVARWAVRVMEQVSEEPVEADA